MAGKLEKFEILLGITGGIAAYKAAVLCSQLVQQGAGVTVVMTTNAMRFVRPLTFGTLSGRKVHTDLFAVEDAYHTQHITLNQGADLIVVAPATANIMAKMAGGICDDLLSTLLCSAESDILLAPAMNQSMWNNQATQRNLKTLKEWGCHFTGPESGQLACGQKGIGRMSEPEEILKRIIEILAVKKPKNFKS